jgi:hypothetical protein
LVVPVPVDDEEENALLAVVAAGAAAADVEPKVVATEDVDVPIEEVEVESMDETDGVPVTSRGAGLSPPAPSSVDPMGIPTRPTGAPPDIPVGDDADAVGEARLGPAVQVPDAVPVVPPSKTVANPVVVPTVEAAPVAGAPKEACGIELLKPEHTARSLVERPEGVVPGEVPGGTISVAPRGIPVGATGASVPMPSGEVMPSGEGVGAPPTVPTWAIAEAGPSATASIAAMMNRDISSAPIAPSRERTPRWPGKFWAEPGYQERDKLCRRCCGWVDLAPNRRDGRFAGGPAIRRRMRQL